MSNQMTAYQEAPWLKALAHLFSQTPLYAVGGAVRNPLMGLPMSDMDVCGPARPEEVMALCEGTKVRAFLRAAHFGTVELHVTDDEGKHHMAEYTTFREDSYRCGHRPEEVRFADSMEVDCLRRDFSVNALYRPFLSEGFGEVIDPTGGLGHLKEGILHTVTENPDLVLGDDGLRILRAVRFEAELGLTPTKALRESLTKNAHLLNDIAPERLRDEWQKIMMADLRYPSIKRKKSATASGLQTLHDCGAWHYVAGEMPYVGNCVQALSSFEVPKGLPVFPCRMAMLLLHANVENMTRLFELCFAKKEIVLVAELIRCYQACENQTLTLFEGAQCGRETIGFCVQALKALGSESLAFAQKKEDRLQSLPCHLKELKVGGQDLLPLFEKHHTPVKYMSTVLHALWKSAVEGEVINHKEDLLVHTEILLDGFAVL